MFKLKTITILICATSVLTSSVTNTKTDGSTKETLVDPIERHRDPGTNYSTLNPITKLEKNLSKDTHGAFTLAVSQLIQQTETTNPSMIAPKTASEATIVAEGIKLTSKGLLSADPKLKVPKTRNASVVARKGVIAASKITARKGVGLETSISTESSIEGSDEAIHSSVSNFNIPIKIEQVTKKMYGKEYPKKAVTEQKSGPVHISLPVPISTTTSTIEITSETPHRNSSSEKVSAPIKTTISDVSATLPTLSTRRFKPKPTVTIGEMDIDKPIPASPTKTPPLGMPRKIDYIVPVIITIMALPLLGGVAFFLYRRGRDCWEKRHYRRMDFLIDGMYNDYSWK